MTVCYMIKPRWCDDVRFCWQDMYVRLNGGPIYNQRQMLYALCQQHERTKRKDFLCYSIDRYLSEQIHRNQKSVSLDGKIHTLGAAQAKEWVIHLAITTNPACILPTRLTMLSSKDISTINAHNRARAAHTSQHSVKGMT